MSTLTPSDAATVAEPAGDLPPCDGWCDRTGTVAMIDTAGFAYCEPCGTRRRTHEPCRALTADELATLRAGRPIARY